MMKRNLLKPLILLFALLVGGLNSAWGQTADVTYDFTSGWTVTDGTLSNGTVSFTGSGGSKPSFKMNNGYFMMGRSGAYINFPIYSSPVSKIVVTGNSGASESVEQNIYVGETAVSTETTGATGTNTYEIASDYQAAGTQYTLKVTSAHNTQITKIEVFFASSADGTYSVTYNSNGADGGTVPTDETKYTDKNNTVTVLGNTGSLVKTGYTFSGWNTKADGSGDDYAAGDNFTISANTTLYAKWEANNYSVTLPADDDYGTYTMDKSNPVAYGTEVTLTYTPAAGYENYAATWSINGTQIDGNKFTMPDEAVTVSVSTAEFIQPTVVTAIFNNVFLGTAEKGRITEATTVTKDGIKYTFDKISGSNWPQGDADLIRMYQNTTLKIEAPSGYVITSITFSNNGDWKSGMTADVGNYDDTLDENNKTYWTGMAQSVTFSPNGTHRITEVVVIVAKEPTDLDIPVAKEYISYCSPYALDFTNVEGLEALVVTKINDTSVSTEAVTTVPAGVGVILHKTDAEATSFNVPVAATATAPAKNFLVGVLKVTTIGGDDTADYVLKDGKFMKANEGKLAAYKAYLNTDANAAPALTIGFGDEGTTGIRSIDNGQLTIDNVYYDLSGRRVAEPTKGVYIVNGKKVVIK